MRRMLAAAVFAALSGLAADVPKITYIKSFPKSTPAYVEITLDKEGHAQYKEAADDENPVGLRLSAKDTAEIFSLADKLEHFSKPLEANLKVANTGMKTFRWENGAEKNETKFNYSLNPDARALWDWFERITETEQSYFNLERAAKYEKLGVNQALLQIEVARDRKRLVAAEQFLPLLDRVAKNETYMHMARERAASLAESFRKAEAQ